MMRTIKVGIITAPERTANIIEGIINELPNKFNKLVDQNVNWEVKYIVDPLTGSAESSHEILHNANTIKHKNEWDFAICLTDLPILFKKDIVTAEVSFKYNIAQISIPNFGWPPMEKRITKTIIHLLSEMLNKTNAKNSSENNSHSQEDIYPKKNTHFIKRVFPIMPIRRQETPYIEDSSLVDSNSNEDNDDNITNTFIDVRYLAIPRLYGLFRLILGMTFANNPMKIMSSFKNIIAIAFTTGAFALIFPTIWKWAQVFSVYRLTALMIVAIIGLVTWIIIAHDLWEHPSQQNNPNISRLYNSATTSTLLIDVMTYYLMMFILFLAATIVLIPPDYLESIIDNVDNESLPVFVHYARVAWIEASISIIVSAMGAGLENDELVRDVTYGYRQNKRYKEINQSKNS